MRLRIFKSAAVILLSASAWTGSLFGQSKPQCTVGDEDVPWSFPACALTTQHGEQYVSPKYLKGSEFNAYGLTWVHLVPGGNVYVNRKGRIVVHDVSTMDNGADFFHRGLVRLERGGKYGFADSKGRIIVPIRYEGASNSEEDGPQVCVGCRTELIGEHGEFKRGQWFNVDARGLLHEISGLK
jgi:hypothetical protein